MAEIQKIESGRVGIANAPSAATPQVVYPSITPEIALIQQAKYQGTMSEKLDRMSQILFREGTDLSQRAGLQFAAENPLTKAQLDAMVKGDMSQVDLGNPMNVFNNAVRKVRAFELSAHAETEASTKLLDIYQKAENGQLDFEGVREQVRAVTDGYGQSLAQVDPESSFKYRASLATMGNKVIDETAKLETKKRMIANGIKVQRNYQNFLKLAEMEYNGDARIDPVTGAPLSKDEVVDALAENFLNNTIALVGINGAQQYSAMVLKDLTDTKINAISKYIAEEFSADPNAFVRLREGDAGRLTDIYQTLGEDAKAKVMQTYLTKIGTDMNIRDANDKANLTAREMQGIELVSRAQRLPEGPAKNAIIRQIADLRIMPFESLKKMATGGGDSNPMVVFNAEEQIYNGSITTSAQIRALPGVSAEDKIKLQRKLFSEVKSDDRELSTELRRLAGIPSGLVALDPKGSEFQRLMEFQADAQNLKAEATRKGEVISNRQIIETLQKKVETRKNSETAKAARTRLEAYEAKAGGPINNQTLSAFEQKLKDGKIKGLDYKRDINAIRNLVRQAEGEI